MKKMFCSAIVLMLVARSALFAADWKSDLQDSYVNKTPLIRGFYEGKSLRYDSTGSLQGDARVGSWTTSFLYIEEMNWNEHSIEIKGARVAQLFDRRRHMFLPVKTGEEVTLTIEPLADIDEDITRKVLAQVFVGPHESLLDLVPDYWKSVIQQTDANRVYTPEPQALALEKTGKECVQVEGTRMVCDVGGGVTAPRALKSPDPEYDKLARRNEIEGSSVLWVEIDNRGIPIKIKVSLPIGFGLDDKAVEAVKKWKFAPATRDGEPVAVEINVVINFRI